MSATAAAAAAAAAAATAVPHNTTPVSMSTAGNGQVLDESGLQHLQVQGHAAAVQLLNRSLAVAHLRAELVKPRGEPVAVIQGGPVSIKREPGVPHQSDSQQPARLWQLPHQPAQQRGSAEPAITIAVSSLQEQAQQDAASAAAAAAAGAQRQQAPPRRQQRPSLGTRSSKAPKPPDLAAAAKWLQEEALAEGDDEGDLLAVGAKQRAQQQPGPRIVANPALQPQQLAGWVRLGADGVSVEAALGQHAGAGEHLAGGAADGVREAGDAPAADEQKQQHAAEEDLMDEEDWV